MKNKQSFCHAIENNHSEKRNSTHFWGLLSTLLAMKHVEIIIRDTIITSAVNKPLLEDSQTTLVLF